MSLKVRIAFLLLGAALFAYLVQQIGFGRILDDAAQTGWMFIPILLLYGLVYLVQSGAWHVILGCEASRPPFWRTVGITISGFSINFITLW